MKILSRVARLKDLEVIMQTARTRLFRQAAKKRSFFLIVPKQDQHPTQTPSIMEKIISQFDKKSSHSVLIGDYIDRGHLSQALRAAFSNHIQTSKNIHSRKL